MPNRIFCPNGLIFCQILEKIIKIDQRVIKICQIWSHCLKMRRKLKAVKNVNREWGTAISYEHVSNPI